MNIDSLDRVPAPRGDNPDLVHQMAVYSSVMEEEGIVARSMTTDARIRLATLLDKISMIGTPSEQTLEGILVIDEKGFPGALGERAIFRRILMRMGDVHNENVWEIMANTSAHYRAALGRYDYLRDVDESAKYNFIDAICIAWKDRTFSGECPVYVPDNPLWPDAVAINNLLTVSPEATAEAYRSYPGRYSLPAFALLQSAGIAGTDPS